MDILMDNEDFEKLRWWVNVKYLWWVGIKNIDDYDVWWYDDDFFIVGYCGSCWM